MDFVRDEPHKLVVAYEGACVVFDAETTGVVARLKGNGTTGVNRVVSHPTVPLIVAAHEDRHIRFYDHRSASLAHAMVAHLDAVTSLAVDPHGLYLLSGSEYFSLSHYLQTFVLIQGGHLTWNSEKSGIVREFQSTWKSNGFYSSQEN